MPKLVLGIVLCASLLALALQQQLTSTHSTLRERLQQVPTQVATAVGAAEASAEAYLGAPGEKKRAPLLPIRASGHAADVGGASGRRKTGGVGGSAATAPPTAATTSQTSSPPPPSPPADGCPNTRRPYHVVLTAASGLYQEWQTRIAYYHYLKLKRENPCSDIGGFTRLLNTPNARPDNLVSDIPTVVVRQLGSGRCAECDHGFIVMNRPYGIRQYVAHEAFANITEEYLFLVETDHLLLRPLPNVASETQPVGFGFYYMTYRYDPRKLKPVVAKYHDPEGVDPVGPSPVIISKKMLARVVEPWWQLCLTLKRDREADGAFGWVLEMWGWALATARLGIRHQVNAKLQAEPGGPGISSLGSYFIYHYTFDIDVTGWGLHPTRYQWSKRRYMGQYPSMLAEAPSNAQRSTHDFVRMMNEAIRSFGEQWGPARSAGGGGERQRIAYRRAK